MPDGKAVVLYGIVVNGPDHHTDYVTVGEWEFLLVERVAVPVVREQQYRIQRRSVRTGRFVGKKSRAKTINVRVPVPERETPTGRYALPRAPVLTFGTLPPDDTLIADTFAIIEEEAGGRMFRTAGQREKGHDRIRIGVQHLTVEQFLSARTYTYAEYLAGVRKRVKNERSYV